MGLGDFAGGLFEEFVDQGSVGFRLFGGHAVELAEKFCGDANGSELFGVAGGAAGCASSMASSTDSRSSGANWRCTAIAVSLMMVPISFSFMAEITSGVARAETQGRRAKSTGRNACATQGKMPPREAAIQAFKGGEKPQA